MKSVVITGANRGIGLELTKQFLDNGDKVYATFRSDSGGLGQINNTNLNTFQLDVRNIELIQKMVESIDGEIDLLINNAGVADGRWQSISEIDMEYALEVINVNAISPLLVTQKFQHKMKKRFKTKVFSIYARSSPHCLHQTQ